MASRYWLGVLPKLARPAPHSWTDWVRLALVLLLVVGGGVGYLTRDWQHRVFTCNDGWPTARAWQVGDRCVGLSDGPYAFGLDAFTEVMARIDAQNESADQHCPDGSPVTVGVLLTMSDQLAGSRAVHELEGMAAGQRRANDIGCLHPMRLLVGQLGDYNGDGDPIAVARELAERDEVVAVAGIGLSQGVTADIANLLASKKIPMVSDVVTAEGFDQNGSRADNPDFDRCDRGYTDGIGKDYYYRIGFRVAVQVEQIGAVVARPDFIMVPVGGSDPYTCTAVPLLQRRYGGDLTEVKFDTEEPSTVLQTARRVCAPAKDVRIAYVARGRDLGRLLSSLDEAYANGQCAATSITVVSTSDGNRLRTTEADAALEELRVKGLGSRSFTEGRVRVLFTLVAGAQGPEDGTANWAAFERAFTGAGFDMAHVGDGWAINAYDALLTIHSALQELPAGATVQRSQVNTTISGFSGPDQAVPGAGGPVVFDNSGNRTGRVPSVVRLCPPSSPLSPTVPTVAAVPDAAIPDCPR